MTHTLGELAKQFQGELRGDPDRVIDRVDSLKSAGGSALTFFSNEALLPQLKDTRAGAVILREKDAALCPVDCIVSDEPYVTFARMAACVTQGPPRESGIHPSAVVSEDASVASTASVMANVVIEDGVTIGEHAVIEAGVFIGKNCNVGAHSRLLANVTLVRAVDLGDRCIIHSGAVIGADGFGNAMSASGWVKVPQVGGVRIGNDVEIGANSTIDCGAIDDTVIGDGVRIDNLCMIAHNVQIGDHTAMAAMSAIAGSTTIGKRCMFAGQVGTVGHITIGDDVFVTGKTMVTKDLPGPGTYSSGWPAEASRDWSRNVARFRRIKSLLERVAKLESGKE